VDSTNTRLSALFPWNATETRVTESLGQKCFCPKGVLGECTSEYAGDALDPTLLSRF